MMISARTKQEEMFRKLSIRTGDAKPLFAITIFGETHSKANSRKLIPNKKTGRIYSIKSQGALDYVESFLGQIQRRRYQRGGGGLPVEPITCKLVMYCTIFYKDERKDLDESLVMDCLEKSGVVKNDRQIRTKFIDHEIDKFNPRTEIILFRRVCLNG